MSGLLDGLEEFVQSDKPEALDQIFYFFLERGITPIMLEELPIPYIMAMLRTHDWVQEQQDKEYNKLRKKR